MKNKKYFKILFAVLFLLVYLSLHLICKFIIIDIFKMNKDISRMITYIFTALVLLISIKLMKKENILKWDKQAFFKSLKLAIPLFIVGLFFIVMNILTTDNIKLNSISHILYWLTIYLIGAGFSEELVTRGVLQNAYLDTFGCNSRKSIILSCLFSATLFGFSHVINTFAKGYIPIEQMIVTIGLGLILCAIYARTRSLWGVMLIHFLWDICVGFDEIFFVVMTDSAAPSKPLFIRIIQALILVSPAVIYFLSLMRKKKINECYDLK